MNANVVRNIGILAGVATILSLCCAIVALVPAFGQWLSLRPPITSSATATETRRDNTNEQATVPPTLTNEPDIAVPPTSIPSDTPIPDTPPGTILEVGQAWRQEGIELRLSDSIGLWPEGVSGQFELTNRRQQDIVLLISQEQFSALDNKGQRLHFDLKLGYGDIERSVPFRSGATIYAAPDGIFITANLSDPALTEIIVAVTGISSINNARWRIPIYH